MTTPPSRPESLHQRLATIWEDFRFRPPYRIHNRLVFAGLAALVISVVLTRVLPRSTYQHPAFAATFILLVFGPFAIQGGVSILYRSYFIAWREVRGSTAIVLGALQVGFFLLFIVWALVRLSQGPYT
ncbi:MAG: hypothetical protein HW404_2051 [Anaerolineales bacterium]|jgi:hypothetical protein|nr:hypothetical protein [Anaerolineales bacterium]